MSDANEPRGPRIPDSASDDIMDIINGATPGDSAECIPNPFPGRETLTRYEALDALSLLSTALLMDERRRR